MEHAWGCSDIKNAGNNSPVALESHREGARVTTVAVVEVKGWEGRQVTHKHCASGLMSWNTHGDAPESKMPVTAQLLKYLIGKGHV